ncbi:MAG: glycosyltransferase [Candidatus Pacearchaeota archaeon]
MKISVIIPTYNEERDVGNCINSLKKKDFKIFFPWMFVFMTVRYFGAINGVFNKIYKDINVR